MPRYFFDTADGDNNVDDDGVELSSDDAAIRQAVRFAGSMLDDQPEILAAKSEFLVSVRKTDAGIIAKIVIALTKH